MNNYISKFSVYETHFARVDKWANVEWQDSKPSQLFPVLAALGFIVCLVLLMFI
jgi:hypothetical protein